jgi:hypothetical protein
VAIVVDRDRDVGDPPEAVEGATDDVGFASDLLHRSLVRPG